MKGYPPYAVPGDFDTRYAQEPDQSTDNNALSSGTNKNKNIQRQEHILRLFIRLGYMDMVE